jgi:hypothetical protein
VLENVARVALKCICRASHVRLPTATLSSLLDETPLGQGEVSSSIVQVDPAIMHLPPSSLPASVCLHDQDASHVPDTVCIMPAYYADPAHDHMQVVQYRNNLASSPAMRGARRHWPLAHQQEGAAHTGMLSLVATQEAKECGGALMSKLQVRMPS